MRAHPAAAPGPLRVIGRVTGVLGLLLFPVVGVVASSVASRAHPLITGGDPDGTAHPYVAMVLVPGARKPSCSGVLVRADTGTPVVLTAAHCFHPGNLRGSGVRVTFAPDFSTAAPTISGTYVVDPRYDPRTHVHDVAVITLSRHSGIAPAGLARLEATSKMPVNTYLDTVGAGHPHSGHRRTATEQMRKESARWLYLVGGSGNSCAGDSGGPDLIRRTSRVVALTDEGTCSYEQDTRLDSTTGSRSFIDQAAGLTGPRRSIGYGAKGIDVKVVRHLLGVSSGITFGPRTVAAVKSWQRAHRIKPSGVVGKLTWHSLGF